MDAGAQGFEHAQSRRKGWTFRQPRVGHLGTLGCHRFRRRRVWAWWWIRSIRRNRGPRALAVFSLTNWSVRTATAQVPCLAASVRRSVIRKAALCRSPTPCERRRPPQGTGREVVCRSLARLAQYELEEKVAWSAWGYDESYPFHEHGQASCLHW